MDLVVFRSRHKEHKGLTVKWLRIKYLVIFMQRMRQPTPRQRRAQSLIGEPSSLKTLITELIITKRSPKAEKACLIESYEG
jgi:hypothetical protein